MMLPTEEQEQATVVQYLQMKRIPHFHVPNSTWTKSWSQKAKNKRMGVVSGPPDLFLILNNKLCAIEMKRKKGGILSPTQKYWIEKLNNSGVETVVCKGAQEAIEFINRGITE